MDQDDWPFPDGPETAVFTSKYVIEDGEVITYVSHDADDGAWQFHVSGKSLDEAAGRIVGLGQVMKLDPSVAKLALLPLGWCAWRENAAAAWQTADDEPHDEDPAADT